MNKKVLVTVAVFIGLLLVCGGVFAYGNNQNDKKEQEKMAMQKKTSDAAMIKKDEAAAMDKEKMAKEGDTMTKQGSYVTIADYNKDPTKYTNSKKVYFFHASWCPICQSIDKEINATMSKIPAGVTMIKTDFDSSTELRQKYGVTTQYTFVQVDDNDNETAQWSATSLDKAIAGIKSQ